MPAGARLVPLGEVSLRDLTRPETVWALAGDGLPEAAPIVVSRTQLRYGLLGPLALWDDDGAPVRVASEQQRLLLAILLVNANQTVSADRLIDELWGDRLPTDPRVALRTQVSRLRKRLGEGAVVTDEAGYRLVVVANDYDVTLFESLLAAGRIDDALELWRGDALAEFADRTFAQPEAVRLNELRQAAREQRAEHLLELDRATDAVADLEALLLDAPERERARGLLMRALYGVGRQTDALDVYQQWRVDLAEDRGLAPSPELQQLEHQILDHALAPPGRGWQQLPRPASSFVGRDAALVAVGAALRDHRIVVLFGAGGVGKTRLAVEAARSVADRYPQGVAFCDLSSVARDADVVRVVAAAIGLEERSPGRLGDQLVSYLERRRCLLVVDNCEHVIDGAAQLVGHLIEGTPGVTVLATTREPLAVPGEQLVTVEPLPTEGDDASAERLFIDRAQSVLPTFDRDRSRSHHRDLPPARRAAPRHRACGGARRAACRSRTWPPPSTAASSCSSALVDETSATDHCAPSLTGRTTCCRHWSKASSTSSPCSRRGSTSTPPTPSSAVTCRPTRPPPRYCAWSTAHSRWRGTARRTTQYAFLDSMRTYGIERLRERNALEAARDHHAAWALALAEDTAVGLAGPDERARASRLNQHFAEIARRPRVAHRP